jgi:hypothetical protein
MLLEQVLSRPAGSPGLLLRADVCEADGRAALVRDVLAAANADAGPVRHVVCGVEPVAGRIRVLGLDRDALERFRAFAGGLADLIEPSLELKPVFAEANGGAVAVLQVSGCNDPPYTLRERVSDTMRTGACWVSAGGELRPARREDLDRIYARRNEPTAVSVEIGMNGDPACQQAEFTVPDSSCPPSERARQQLLAAINAKKAAEEVLETEDTGMARLSHARIFGQSVPFVPRGMDTLIQQYNLATDDCADADQFYFYEQQAVRLELTVRNNEQSPLDAVEVELNLPQVPGFEVAERLCPDPDGSRSGIEFALLGYPEVRCMARQAVVRANIGTLPAGRALPLFETPLRLRVGPGMRGMKVAIKYQLTARGLVEPLRGRLKLVFRR